MASFFRPQFYSAAPEPNFTGLFRLIDDFDRYSTQQNGANCQRHSRQVPTFTPKFDLKETESAFELHGELPGINKEDLHIEFTDPQTLMVRGKVERTYTAGTPPAGLVENGQEKTAALPEAGEEPVVIDHHSDTASHHATVEDDTEDDTNATTGSQNTPATTVAEVAKPAEKPAEKAKPAAPKQKYYLIERNIGQFSRVFTFPSRVDHESVSASLDNGILTVTVQKAKKHESRRIAIN